MPLYVIDAPLTPRICAMSNLAALPLSLWASAKASRRARELVTTARESTEERDPGPRPMTILRMLHQRHVTYLEEAKQSIVAAKDPKS
jgi:hypothetical protein